MQSLCRLYSLSTGGVLLYTGLLMDFQGVSSIFSARITTRALLFLAIFMMLSSSMGFHFVSEVIAAVKM